MGGPPPPPGMGPPPPGGKGADPLANLPPKPVINPTQPMKRLAWKKIPNNKIPTTVWKESKTLFNENDSYTLAVDVIEIDPNTIEYLFAAKQAAPKEKSKAVKEKKQVVSLLEPKRANHV